MKKLNKYNDSFISEGDQGQQEVEGLSPREEEKSSDDDYGDIEEIFERLNRS
jgi:hypothetical protein